MVNLVALVWIVLAAAQPPAAPVDDPPHSTQAQNAPPAAARQLTPAQKAWFAHAIDHILTGD